MINNGDYDKLLERLINASKISKDEIEKKVEAKRAKLSGLVSKEGALQIVAAELGISLDSERLKLGEIKDGYRRVNVIGKITKIFPVREFKKNEREGKVASFSLGDESENKRIVLWDVNHINLIEKGKLKEGDVVEIRNANVKNGELHLGSFSDIKQSSEFIGDVKTEGKSDFAIGKLVGVQEGVKMKVRAVIVQMFDPRYFDSKKNEGEKGAVLNVVLDDGSETIRGVLFNENIKKFGLADEDVFDLGKFNLKKEQILGEERFFVGNIRKNEFFDRLEMSINGIEEVDVERLVGEMEKIAL